MPAVTVGPDRNDGFVVLPSCKACPVGMERGENPFGHNFGRK